MKTRGTNSMEPSPHFNQDLSINHVCRLKKNYISTNNPQTYSLGGLSNQRKNEIQINLHRPHSQKQQNQMKAKLESI